MEGNFTDHPNTDKEPRNFCSNKGKLGCGQLHISVLLLHLSLFIHVFCAFETIQTDFSMESVEVYCAIPKLMSAIREVSKALNPNGLASVQALVLDLSQVVL